MTEPERVEPVREQGRDTTLLWIALGTMIGMGSCCVGMGGVAWYAMENEDEIYEEPVYLEEVPEWMTKAAPPPPIEEEPAFTLGVIPSALSLPVPPAASSDRRTRHVQAEVTRSLGPTGVAVGDTCAFDVEVLERSDGTYWCRAFVDCAGVPLYGSASENNGYFWCELVDEPFGVAGEDLEITPRIAGDPFFQIDTRAGTMTVLDGTMSRMVPAGEYLIEARIQSVTPLESETEEDDELDLEAGIVERSETSFTIERELASGLRDSDVLASGRFIPHQEGGATVGLKIYGVRSDSLLGLLGIRNGDMVRSVGGRSLATTDDVARALSALRGQDEVRVELDRRGVATTLEYRIR